jgi:hypothetical protein
MSNFALLWGGLELGAPPEKPPGAGYGQRRSLG